MDFGRKFYSEPIERIKYESQFYAHNQIKKEFLYFLLNNENKQGFSFFLSFLKGSLF